MDFHDGFSWLAGFKETGFLYAISSAGLVHTVARACSRGQTDRCTCDESVNQLENREAWMWGGCGDNMKYAQKFTRRFLRARKLGRDLRAKVDKHNSKLGIKVRQFGYKARIGSTEGMCVNWTVHSE